MASAPAVPRLRRPREGRARTAVAMARGELTWRLRPAARRQAIATAEALLGASARASEVEHIAHRQLVEHAVRTMRDERGLDPWLPVRGEEHLAAVRRAHDGRAVLATLHLGQIADVSMALAPFGHPFTLPFGAWVRDEHPAVRRRADLVMARVRALGLEPVVSAGSGAFAAFEAALDAGRPVSIPFDVPGSAPTRYLGRDLAMASGGTRLAWSRGVPVVPSAFTRDGVRSAVELHAPVAPGTFTDEASFRAALMGRLEALTLAHAEVLDAYALHALFGDQLGPGRKAA